MTGKKKKKNSLRVSHLEEKQERKKKQRGFSSLRKRSGRNEARHLKVTFLIRPENKGGAITIKGGEPCSKK